MREADKIECRSLGRTPKEALRLGLRMSSHALTAIDDAGRPVAMFGVVAVSMLGGVGTPWFLGTDDVFMHPRELLSTGPKVIRWWSSEFPRMENVVAVNNHAAIRLLRKWGAEIGDKVEKHGGVEFVAFTIQAAAANA